MSVYTFNSYILEWVQSTTNPTLLGGLEVMEKLVHVIMHNDHLSKLQIQLINFSPTNILVQRKSMQFQYATYDLGIRM